MLDIQKVFIKKGITLSLAESCTGGLIASLLTKTPGASNYFLGGIVSYTDTMKINVLGVSKELIEEKSAVDLEVAKQMCRGALKVTGSDYAIAVTGDAGPDGDQVGTVYGAIGSNEGVYAGKIPSLEGLSREEVQQKCAAFLLLKLYALVEAAEVPFAHQ